MQIHISSDFKRMTFRAIFAIISFILVYFILLVCATGLTALCVYLGFALIAIKPMFFTIVFGLGLASFGIFIIFFLFKFLFKSHKIDKSNLILITRKEEPKLFKFIDEIVAQVETKRPKRVYLSPEVNASVFYDSNFWSMFFPIRKNLQIGMGLVNSISEQELKAILAHEFGHFSQRSMKVGSYVYNVNQVIFNMLYDNSSFEEMIRVWSNISNYFSIFVFFANKIIEGIQWILRKMYDFVNVSYMALSREMEFHADEVAANVAGYEPLKDSLMRLDLADHSYQAVLSYYGSKISENLKSSNIFREQLFVMNFLAKENNIPFKDNLPSISSFDANKYAKSKLNVKDQWASHPSIAERVESLEKLNIKKDYDPNRKAIDLFVDPNKIKNIVTEKVFSQVTYSDSATDLSFETFEQEYLETFKKNSFSEEYNGYYDNKNPIPFDIEVAVKESNSKNIEELFGPAMIDIVYEFLSLEGDLIALRAISNGDFKIKSFDYDGQKYNREEAFILIPTLEKRMEELNLLLKENDKNVFLFFLEKAEEKDKGNYLKGKYRAFFDQDEAFEKKVELYNELIESTRFFYVVTPNEEIKRKLSSVALLEIKLKNELKGILSKEFIKSDLDKNQSAEVEKYLSQDWIYFEEDSYHDDLLQLLMNSIQEFRYLINRDYFLTKLHLLNFQIQLLS